MTLAIDHLISCVSDLDEAGERYFSEFGLVSVVGGRHTGHGTANRIIPLGTAYIELVAVVDSEEGENSQFAAWVTEHARTDGLDALVLRTDDIDAVANMLGLKPLGMSRLRGDGLELSWRLAGLEQLLSHGLPPVIQWDIEETLLPGRTETEPPNPSGGFDEVVISGNLERLTKRTAGCPGLRIVEGEPGVVSVTVGSVRLS